jgi:hypothetical protein
MRNEEEEGRREDGGGKGMEREGRGRKGIRVLQQPPVHTHTMAIHISFIQTHIKHIQRPL